jgi:molybdopterin-guanine dinucleotide biosynthesis protein A
MAERQQLKIQQLFQQEELRIAILGENEFLPFASRVRSFRNINTPDDLALAESPPPIDL